MERQERHEKIVEFLNSLKDTEGNKAFNLKTYPKLRDGGEYLKTRDYQEVSKMTPAPERLHRVPSSHTTPPHS